MPLQPLQNPWWRTFAASTAWSTRKLWPVQTWFEVHKKRGPTAISRFFRPREGGLSAIWGAVMPFFGKNIICSTVQRCTGGNPNVRRKEILRSHGERKRHEPSICEQATPRCSLEGRNARTHEHPPTRAWHQACPRLHGQHLDGRQACWRPCLAPRQDQEGQRQEARHRAPLSAACC